MPKFSSVGASATNALLQVLAERRELERRAVLDEQNRQMQEAQIRDRSRGLDQSQQEMDRRKQEQDFSEASVIQAAAGANATVDNPTADKLDRAGFGGRVQRGAAKMGTPGIGVLAIDELPQDAHVTEEVNALQPGFAYEQAREAGAERENQARIAASQRDTAARIAADERAERATADRTSREAIAAEGNKTRETIAGLTASTRAEAAQAKVDEKEAIRAKAAQGVRDSASEALATIDQLLSPDGHLMPGVSKIVGRMRVPKAIAGLPLVGSEEAATKYAALDKLISTQIVDVMAKMKAQSPTGATGFGALNLEELNILRTAASQLQTAQSEPEFERQLKVVRDKFMKLLQPDIDMLRHGPEQRDAMPGVIAAPPAGRGAPPGQTPPAAGTPPVAPSRGRVSAADFINQHRYQPSQ